MDLSFGSAVRAHRLAPPFERQVPAGVFELRGAQEAIF
jgi:hypothetical protein